MIKCIVFLVFITAIEAARILAVFPTPSISHQVVFRPITQELANRGHEVVVITPDPAFAKENLPPNLIEIDVHNISYQKWKEEFIHLRMGKDNDMPSHVRIIVNLIVKVFEEQMKVKEIKDIIQENNQFDLLLLEACVRPALALSHIFKTPVIHISSFGAMFGMNKAAGLPTHPILYPSIVSQRVFNLTMWEKISEAYNYYNVENIYNSMEPQENEIIKNVFRGHNIPPLSELYDNVDMFFLNVDPVWANNQPVPPNIAYIGGIHQTPKNALPEDLQSYLDTSRFGVIYISFGTNVQSSQIPQHVVKAMVKVFGQLKYNIIWKWDGNQSNIPSNVKVYKWVPQTDLLRHPKVKLFITQGGLQSTQEAILAGVPLIGIPSFGDQWYNVDKYAYHKIGMKLEMSLLTEESFKKSIESVLEDESYRKNIIKLRDIMLDQPQSPLERAIWWTEYVLRHGGARHLRSPAANMSWTEYYELRLVGLLATICIILLGAVGISVQYGMTALYSWNCFLFKRPKSKTV